MIRYGRMKQKQKPALPMVLIYTISYGSLSILLTTT